MSTSGLDDTESSKIAKALPLPIDLTFGVEGKVCADNLAILDEHETMIGRIGHPLGAHPLRPGLGSQARIQLTMQELGHLIDVTIADRT
jgi:hypothetical protein